MVVDSFNSAILQSCCLSGDFNPWSDSVSSMIYRPKPLLQAAFLISLLGEFTRTLLNLPALCRLGITTVKCGLDHGLLKGRPSFTLDKSR